MSEVINGDAGRVGFLIKGDYDNNVKYDFLDIVYYESSSYVARKETMGNPPQEDNEYWKIFAKGGVSLDAYVTGVKGNAEEEYRTGNVNITKADIGLDKVENYVQAKKSIYNDTSVSMGRKEDTSVGEESFAFGYNTEASGANSHAEGRLSRATAFTSHAEGSNTRATGLQAHAEGLSTIASGARSHASGSHTIANGSCQMVCGEYNNPIGGVDSIANLFVIGNGSEENVRSNAFRVYYTGAVYGKGEYNSSGADYAEFICPWADGNENNEDRVGYFVTVKDGYLYKANEGDYIVGITSGNPSVVGNSDEEYYWRWERDEFNRIIYEDIPELTEKIDENGDIVIDEETGKPVMEETGRMQKTPKQSEDYDDTLQQSYTERKDRKEWDYVGMVGVVPVRDDGTCEAGRYCKCGIDGVATISEKRDFDTYMVLERINDNVVSVILK